MLHRFLEVEGDTVHGEFRRARLASRAGVSAVALALVQLGETRANDLLAPPVFSSFAINSRLSSSS